MASCTAHVNLERAPDLHAPAAVRSDYYATHAPKAPTRAELEVNTRIGDRSPSVRQTSVTLRNDTHLQNATDVMPLVNPDSATARAALAFEAAQQRSSIFVASGAAATGIGVAVALAFLLADIGVFADQGSQNAPNQAPVFAIAGGSSLAVGALLGGGLVVFGMRDHNDADDARDLAFRSLDADLRVRLGIAAGGVPAPAGPSTTPPPSSAGFADPSDGAP